MGPHAAPHRCPRGLARVAPAASWLGPAASSLGLGFEGAAFPQDRTWPRLRSRGPGRSSLQRRHLPARGGHLLAPGVGGALPDREKSLPGPRLRQGVHRGRAAASEVPWGLRATHT